MFFKKDRERKARYKEKIKRMHFKDLDKEEISSPKLALILMIIGFTITIISIIIGVIFMYRIFF